MKKMIALLIVLSLIFSSAAISVAAANFDDILIAVNTNTTESAAEGKFTVKDEINSNISGFELSTEPEYNGLNESYSSGIDDSGLIILNPNLPEYIPGLSDKLNPDYGISDSGVLSKVGDTKTITMYDEKTRIELKCLYIGTYCTVWVQTDCNTNIQLTSQQAEKIGKEFDSKIGKLNDYFPDAKKIDCDNDEKIGIYCYDIDKNYGKPVTSYTAGYFWSYDFSLNESDMIHIDTYPGMGSGSSYLQDIERCYGTLFHEYQHYINYSTRQGSNYHPMETYLNEAFSMAVEQLIYGSDSMKSRINYFNSSMTTITNGLAMTVWNSNDSLPQYSLAYVFGQYLRIRYNQLNGVKENMLFNEVMKKIATTKYTNTLDVVADLLNTQKEELIKDFWTALYLRENTGKYGFNGDDCIKNLNNVYVNTNVTSSTVKGIYNGGVKFYGISSNDEVVITSHSNLSFYFGNSNTMSIELKPEPSFISRILDILLAPFRIIMNGFTAIWQAIFGGNKNIEYEVSLLKDGVNVATVMTTATSYDFTKEIMKNGVGIYSVIVTALGDGITTANSESVKSDNTFTYNGGGTSILSGVTISNQCVVKVSSGKGGSISQEGTLVVPTGINIKFDIIPNEGYEIKDVLINGISIGAVSSCKYTADISLPYSTIYAEFEKITVDDIIYEPPNIDPVPVD